MRKSYRICLNTVCIAVFFILLFSSFYMFMCHESAGERSGRKNHVSTVSSGHFFSNSEHSGTEKSEVSLCIQKSAVLPEFRSCSSLRFPTYETIRRWEKDVEQNSLTAGFPAVLFYIFFQLFSGVSSRPYLFLQSQFYVVLRILLRKDGKSRFFLFS